MMQLCEKGKQEASRYHVVMLHMTTMKYCMFEIELAHSVLLSYDQHSELVDVKIEPKLGMAMLVCQLTTLVHKAQS